jgi:hypothetical protein
MSNSGQNLAASGTMVMAGVFTNRNGSIAAVVLVLVGLALSLNSRAVSETAKAPETAAGTSTTPAANAAKSDNVCPMRPAAGLAVPSKIVVALASDTLWRPAGGEVRFTVTDTAGSTIAVKQVQVCLGWSYSEENASDALYPLTPSPEVHATTYDGNKVTYGAVVPDLQWPTWHLPWNHGAVPFAAVNVPLTDMVVAVTLADDPTPQVVMLPVGVTSVVFAFFLVAICITLFFGCCWVITRKKDIPGGNLLLKMICTTDGYASLSQFQILWKRR